MVTRPALLVVALGCLVAAVVWGRSTLRLERAWRRITRAEGATGPGTAAARLGFRKEFHTTLLYAALAVGTGVASISSNTWFLAPFVLLLVPIFLSLRYGRQILAEARLTEERWLVERRALEVLEQQNELTPLRWSARLAPGDLPTIHGFEVAHLYEPGRGAMAGDFYDLFPNGTSRLAAVIGDVAGHGIEPSITAFQVKYLLRVFLTQYRDPAQAIEELNVVLSTQGRPEDLVSLCAVVFDQAAATLRFASAGHPPAWVWHDGEVRALRATGPLLTLDPNGSYFSKEIDLAPGDVLVMYTDGLTEARSGDQLFGEERIAQILRRDPGDELTALCKGLLEAARDFASEPLTDDVAILAIRRT
ncbi:MAG TPA: PP2C family protein-serine/threonine phosphatase [Acidimicrobiales bacterium]|nr:PP2C family protein-serine/threonine phosphatase [Acidimicrobiales bacterium]